MYIFEHSFVINAHYVFANIGQQKKEIHINFAV